MRSYMPAEAKGKFLSICRSVLADKQKVSIKAASGKSVVVLDYINRTKCTVFAEASAQGYKDNFAAYSRLASYGITFKLSLKGVSSPIFVRKFSSYSSSAGLILKKWSEDRVDNAIKNERDKILENLGGLGPKIEDQNHAIAQLQSIIKLGMERIAIGHHPSREGQIQRLFLDENE